MLVSLRFWVGFALSLVPSYLCATTTCETSPLSQLSSREIATIQRKVEEQQKPIAVVGGAINRRHAESDIDYVAPWPTQDWYPSDYDGLPGLEHPPFGAKPDYRLGPVILFSPGQKPLYVRPLEEIFPPRRHPD